MRGTVSPSEAATRRTRRTVAARGLSAALFSAMLLAAVPRAWGEESPPAEEPLGTLKKLSLEQLFELEVTSVSQKPEALSRTAAAIHVVTQDDIRRMGALSIPEALRNIPGVEVARVNSRDYAITARGFNGTIANKLLVLIDGRSVYTPLYSGVFWDVQDTFMEDVEQIEVIRGPGATIWGSNAVNGVINVITKDAAHTQGWTITAGAGTAERGFGGARYGGALGSHGFFRVYGKHLDRDDSLRPSGQEVGDEFLMSQGGFRIDWTPAEADGFTLQGDGYGGTAWQGSADATDLAGGNVLAQWTRRFSANSNLQLQAYYDHTDRNVPGSFGEVLDTYDATLRHRFATGRHDVVWGLGHRQTRDDVHNYASLAFLPADLRQNLSTFFIQDEVALAENRLHVIVGSKFEHNDYTGFEYQPSGRFAWTPSAFHTLWAAASRAVRTPSRIDRDLFAPPQPPYFLIGSPDFESEVLRAFELGYKVQAAENLTASVATFYNLYDKLRSVEAVALPFYLTNGFTGQTYGVEVEATCQASARWRLNPGYTFLRLDLDTAPGSTDTTARYQEGDSPRHQFFVRSSLTLPRDVALDVTLRHVSELPHQQVPAYTTADARLAWQSTSVIELALVGQNLFDPQHPEFGTPASRREVERSLYGKATCHF